MAERAVDAARRSAADGTVSIGGGTGGGEPVHPRATVGGLGAARGLPSQPDIGSRSGAPAGGAPFEPAFEFVVIPTGTS